ncbi:MAG: sugar O-acetyltransferase [Chitinophagales bacterium]
MGSHSEYQKMLAGELYNASDPELIELRMRARKLLTAYNQLPFDRALRQLSITGLLGKIGDNVDIQTPFFCDYGLHIEAGDNFFANFNCIFLDCNYIRIGNNVFLGPLVQIYTAYHPLEAVDRIKGPELAGSVNIGDNVWIGGGAIICAKVNIGSNTTIGAGSVVTRNIPSNVFAAGNPCRVIKTLIDGRGS